MPDEETQPVFTSAEAAKEPPIDFPGQVLRYEREKAGLSVEDVARQLLLSTAVIRNLEDGNADELPEAVYTRGYIRAYCKLLKISPDSLLEDLVPEGSGQEEDFLPAMNERVHHLTRLWGSFIVLSVVILLVSFWWMEQPREPEMFWLSQPAPEPPASSSSHEESPAAAAEPAEVSGYGEADDLPPRSGVFDDAGMDRDAGTAEITVSSSEKSWAYLVDGTGEVLLRRILPAGYRNTVRGAFPLDFEFGDARGVRVWIGGVEYNLRPHLSRLNTAFFRIEGPLR